ncbi:transporter [Pseudomaricurvus sp. HS19]|uniref:transporter n=1 Tax=Pseudomaricurvus sp. HS19 TaxID=2692626 RepID=UPI00136D8E1E|nr:transporter [Pseudomaricurvus sp. HS19]MYM63028.1 hypothetical protein [Pseudomaricurvus sp. HS19]
MHALCKQTSIVTLLLLASATAAAADERPWKYTAGIDYSTGDYGDPADTDIFFLPVSVAYTDGNWTYKATASLLEIDGPGTVVGGGGDGIVVPGNSTQTKTEDGLGDTWLSASYFVEELPTDAFYLSLGGKIKLPTADEDKGLGTGETDYALVADLFKPMGRYTPFATLAYKIKGDPPQGNLDNVFALSVGSDYRWTDDANLGASVDYQQSATNSDDQLELFAYLNQRLSPQTSLMVYGYLGLTDGSPDLGTGIQISYRP